MVRMTAWPHSVARALTVLAVVGCSGAGEDPAGGSSVVGSIDTDGYIAVLLGTPTATVGGPTEQNQRVAILDPRTGRLGPPFEIARFGEAEGIIASPDGRLFAWWEPRLQGAVEKPSYWMYVGHVVSSEAGPTLESVHDWQIDSVEGRIGMPFFTGDGDRLVIPAEQATIRVNLVDWSVTAVPTGSNPAFPFPIDVATSPDGRHHMARVRPVHDSGLTAWALYEDDERIWYVENVHNTPYFSPDGQWVVLAGPNPTFRGPVGHPTVGRGYQLLHVPSRVVTRHATGTFTDEVGVGFQAGVAGEMGWAPPHPRFHPNGNLLGRWRGSNGVWLGDGSSSIGTIQVQNMHVEKPEASVQLDVAQVITQDALVAAREHVIALDTSHYTEGDTTEWETLGFSGGGRWEHVRVTELGLVDAGSSTSEGVTRKRVELRPVEERYVLIDGQTGDSVFVRAQPEELSRRKTGLVVAGDGNVLFTPFDEISAVGWSTDKGTWELRQGFGTVLSPDRRWVAGATRTRDGPTSLLGDPVVCFRPIANPGDLRCLDVPNRVNPAITPRPLAWGGYRMAGGASAANGPAKVLHLSQTAACPGQEVHVHGLGFGAAGSLRIGDFQVPASDVLSWADGLVAFVMPAGAPELGRLAVAGPNGFQAEGAPHELARTARWTPPMTAVPAEATFGNGCNRLEIPDRDGRPLAAGLLDRFVPDTFMGIMGATGPATRPDVAYVHAAFTGDDHRLRIAHDNLIYTVQINATFGAPMVADPMERAVPGEWRSLGDAIGNDLELAAGLVYSTEMGALVVPTDCAFSRGSLLGHPFSLDWITVPLASDGRGGWMKLFEGRAWVLDGWSLPEDLSAASPRFASEEWYYPEALEPRAVGLISDDAIAPVRQNGEPRFPSLWRSHDGGQTWTETTNYLAAAPDLWAFIGPIVPTMVPVYSGPGRGLYVDAAFVDPATNVQHSGLSRFRVDMPGTDQFGAFDPDIGPSPPGVMRGLGDSLIAGSDTLHTADLSAVPIAWTPITAGDTAGRVAAWNVDGIGERLVLVRDDGVLFVAPAADPSALAAVGPPLAAPVLPAPVVFSGIGIDPAGMVVVQTTDPSNGKLLAAWVTRLP